jgi:N,N'-diacetyllegionaminate synthase
MRQPVIIIAEAGVNHNGSIELAKQLVDIAAEAGADYVKFQTFKADKIASKQAVKADYQAKTTDAAESQLVMLKKLELSYQDHITLIGYCKEKNIRFLSTPFDLDSIELLKGLNIRLGKIPSGEITNLPYLRAMAAAFDELVLSTGMCDMKEIEEAVAVLLQAGFLKDNITILHCNTEYPTPFADVNLLAMNTIAEQLHVKAGYSDHTQGIEVPVAATALGACLIEKHFTIDRAMEGPDHKASLEPAELKAMVQAIRHIEQALGNGIKQPSPSEMKNREIARKSIVAAKDLLPGHIISISDIAIKRPGNGISPMLIETIIGKQLTKAVHEDDVLTNDCFK